MATLYGQGKRAILNIAVTTQKYLLCEDSGNITGFVRIVIPAAALIGKPFEQCLVGAAPHCHGGQGYLVICVNVYHVIKIGCLPHAVRQKDYMFDRYITLGKYPACLAQGWLNRRSAAVTYLLDFFLNRCLVVRLPKLHLPAEFVVKGQDAYIIRVLKIVDRHRCSPDGDI